MKKEIRTHSLRMTGTFVLLVALAVWQIDFVITSINANIYLNATIIGVFLFGVFLAYRGVLGVGTDLLAFDALKEEYSDVRAQESAEEGDPNWRYKRCDKPAVVFTRPSILGQSYLLCSDEIGRTGDLQLSAGTMSTLVEGIDIRLDEQRSLLNYVVGILVMLGLIGTFVGLMGTLASVGDIIGGLDLSGGAGTEVIQNLMTSLQAPLAGMATGFSSSLFGLITSLTLGLMTRFNSQALNVVRMGFEGWLGGVAQIEAGRGDQGAGGDGSGVGLEGDEKRILFRAARQAVVSTSRMSDLTQDLTKEVARLRGDTAQNREVLRDLTRHMAEMTANQEQFAVSVNQVAKTLSLQSDMLATVKAMDGAFAAHQARVDVTLKQTERLVSETLQSNTSVERRIADMSEHLAGQAKAVGHIAALDQSVVAGFDQTSSGLLSMDDRLASVETRLVAPSADDERNEREALLAQIDGLIAINRLSDEDARALKQLAALYRDAGITADSLHAAIGLVDAPEPAAEQVVPDPRAEREMDEAFGLFDPETAQDEAKVG